MRIRMHTAGFHIREILKQSVQNVGRLVGSAGDKAAKQRDVIIGDMAVSNASGLAITDVMFGE